MLKLSDVLRGWFKGVNTLAFSACLRLERGHLGSSSFAFTLYDETHNDVQIPCVVQPSSFYILQGLNLHMHERTKVVVDVWCIVHGYFKHIEVTSLHVDVPLSITNCSQFHEVPVTKTGFIVGKSALLRRGSFSVRLVNNQGEFFVLCDNWIFCVLSYEFISPGACIKFIGLQPGRCNDVLLVTEKTSIHKVSDPCLRLLGTDRFVGVITSLGIVPLHPYTTKKLFYRLLFLSFFIYLRLV